jgi:hypothetical protein
MTDEREKAMNKDIDALTALARRARPVRRPPKTVAL